MLELGVKSLLSYLLGSVMGALLVGRLRGGVDIRNVGSGNAGGTNALRTQGKVFASWVMVIDIGKGVIAAAVVPHIGIPGVGIDADIDRDWLTVACAALAILGHVYPLWHEFRGGKGAATLLGTLLGIQPVLLLPVLGVWFAAVMVFGYVGLATIFASWSLPIYFAYSPAPDAWLAFGIFVAIFVTFTHRSNIARMRKGEENRVGRLWLLRR